MNFPYRAPFSLITLTDWVQRHSATWVGMTDQQYSFFCNLMRCNKKDVNGVPIKFLKRTCMKIDGRKVQKKITEARILAALPPGHRLVGINWKKGGAIHVVDNFGKRRVISMRNVAA